MENINVKNKLKTMARILSFDVPITRKFILIYFSISFIAFLFILIGGRVLTLSSDEMFFLNDAYRSIQDWNQSGLDKTFSQPYELYQKFLSLFMAKDAPSNIWFAVIFDSANQILCILLLIFLSLKFYCKRNFSLFILLSTGILFFFTIGRLAEHRPDYLSVTFLTLSYLFLISVFLEHKDKNNLPAILGGICLGLAICLSPRSLVLIFFSLPIIALYICFTYTFHTWFKILLLWASSMTVTFLIMSWLFHFQIWEVIYSLLNDNYMPDREPLPLNLRLSYHARYYQTAIMLVTLLSSASMLMFSILNKKQKLLLFVSASVSLAQLGLIVYDKNIYGYGYSYGLFAYIALILAIYDNWRKPNISIMWFFTPLILSIIFMLQVKHLITNSDYHYNWRADLTTNFDKSSSVEELVNNLNTLSLINSLNTRILLCDKLKNARFISRPHNNMLCMESHYPYYNKVTQKNDTVIPLTFFYTKSRKELQEILLNLGLNKNSMGILFIPNKDGYFDSHNTKYISY